MKRKNDHMRKRVNDIQTHVLMLLFMKGLARIPIGTFIALNKLTKVTQQNDLKEEEQLELTYHWQETPRE
jgi:hypothetical protein